MVRTHLGAAAVMGLLLGASSARAILIDFRYDYDSSGFFADQERRDRLNDAAAFFTPFLDDLAPIQPDPPINSWTADFNNPSTGAGELIDNLPVPADTLIVYVGAQNISAPGGGGPGGYGGVTADPSLSFGDTVAARGQAGALSGTPTDFGPWGGTITFDSDAPWHFGATTAGLDSSEYDFLSVAIHELAHVLGFGIAPSWDTWRPGLGLSFNGPASVDRYGGAVPLADAEHWNFGLTDVLNGTSQEVAMDPDITVGTRKVFTRLDYAGLNDVGWVPEPTTLLLLAFGCLAASRRVRGSSRPGASRTV